MAHQKISRAVAASVTSLGLVVGFAGMAGAATNNSTVSGNGADSSNHVKTSNVDKLRVHNDNDVSLKNNNPQWATTGDAHSSKNTGGSSNATSGDAHNTSSMKASVTLNNSSAMGGSGGGNSSSTATISGNGADSHSTVKTVNMTSTKVTNDNDVHVTNNNWQAAASGDASAYKNTGGNSTATSGDASNMSSSEFTVNVTN